MHLKLSKADIARILIFNTVMKTKSMTQTAHALNISHSSVYMAIKKLRVLYNDELFVHDKKGLLPTEFANRLHTEMLGLHNSQLKVQASADSSHRTHFIFSCAPHLAATVIPLTYQVMQETLSFSLEHKPLPDTPEARIELLLNNKADVIFDYAPVQHDDIYFKRLFTEDYAIVCRKEHPRFSDAISLKEFYQEKQAAVGCLSRFDNLIQESNTDNVFFSSHYYLVLLSMVEVSDIICVIPVNIYLKLHASFNIKSLSYRFKVNTKKTYLYINYLKDPTRIKDKDVLLKKIEKMH